MIDKVFFYFIGVGNMLSTPSFSAGLAGPSLRRCSTGVSPTTALSVNVWLLSGIILSFLDIDSLRPPARNVALALLRQLQQLHQTAL